jgi:hypothetical protein
MKLLLCAFGNLPGLKINFYKSGLFCYGQAKRWKANIPKILDVT